MRLLDVCLALLLAVVGLQAAHAADIAPERIVVTPAADLISRVRQIGNVWTLPTGRRRVHIVLPAGKLHDLESLRRVSGRIDIEAMPGVAIRSFASGKSLVLELAKPQSTRVGPPPAAGTTAPRIVAGYDTLIPGLPAGMTASIVGQAPKTGVPPAIAVSSNAAPSLPRPLEIARPALSAAPTGPSGGAGCLMVAAGHSAGIAVYRRGENTIVVIDHGNSAVSPGEGSWWLAHVPEITTTSDWTILRVPTSPAEGLRIERQVGGLCLTGAQASGSSGTALAYEVRAGSLAFSLPRPGRSLAVADPVTHALMLVGTDGGAAGGLHPQRRSATFSLLQSTAGVIVEPLSDRLQLLRQSDGFHLIMDGAASIHVPAGFTDLPTASVDGLTRTLVIPDEPVGQLVQLMHRRALDAALAPSRARGDRRLDLATTMVGLGLGAEAQSVVLAASADDPAVAASPRAALLGAIAAMLDQRKAVAGFLDAPSFPDTEEGDLWRALAWSPPRPAAPAAVTVRRGLPLLLSYPLPLRLAAAREAARVLLADDDPAALRTIGLLPDSEAVELARARADDRLGHPAEALRAVTGLARSRDLGIAADSLREQVRLRLAAGQITPAMAADILDAHRLDWRVTGQEGAALLNEAQDRLLASSHRAAFALWDDAVRADPTLRAEVEKRRLAALHRLTEPGVASAVSASDYASIIEENSEALTDGTDLAVRAGLILADKFSALGLDDHAAATLDRLAAAQPTGAGRAALDTRLASLDVARGDVAGATSALGRDSDADLAPALVAQRRLVRVRLLDAQGKPTDALALLADDDADAALGLRAKLHLERGEWHAALEPLEKAYGHLPAHGPLDETQGALALQLVAASVRDDAPTSISLAREIAPRLSDEGERRSLEVLVAPLADAATSRASPGAAGGI